MQVRHSRQTASHSSVFTVVVLVHEVEYTGAYILAQVIVVVLEYSIVR